MEPDLTTISGIVVVAMSLTAVIVKKLEISSDSTKKLISAGIAGGLGVAARLLGVGFLELDWPDLAAGIVAAIFATKLSYDAVVKPVTQKVTHKKS